MKISNVLLLALAFLVAAPGFAADSRDDDVEKYGKCTGSSKSEISLSPENGKLEIEFEVEGKANELWNVVIKRRGKTIYNANRTTGGTSRSFTARVVNGPGTGGQVSAVATNKRTGEKCSVSASFA